MERRLDDLPLAYDSRVMTDARKQLAFAVSIINHDKSKNIARNTRSRCRSGSTLPGVCGRTHFRGAGSVIEKRLQASALANHDCRGQTGYIRTPRALDVIILSSTNGNIFQGGLSQSRCGGTQSMRNPLNPREVRS